MELEELVLEEARRRGMSLSGKELRTILRDLSRWQARNGETRILKTADGSFTLFSGKYGEPYHSVSAGAVRECLHKFLIPSGLLRRKERRIRILDVGFGLGYNVAVALYHLRRLCPAPEVEILSMDEELPSKILLLPEPYRDTHREILSLLPSGEKQGVRLDLLIGDARRNVLRARGFGAYGVFHDPFSPYRNPQLWTLDFLREIKACMDPSGVWVSYSSALPVRKALAELGFRVGSSKPVGRKRSGTVALLTGNPPPLKAEEEAKLNTSPYSVPFRDPSLERSPVEILIDYRLSVLQREREISSAA